MFRIVTLFIIFTLGCKGLFAQPLLLTIDTCYRLAEQNYPLVRQLGIIEKTQEYNLSNVAKGVLPVLWVQGQATYQSEVTRVPISFPGMSIEELSRDQYRLYGEVVQPITDLFTVHYQKEHITATAQTEAQKIKTELYKLRERINQLFFGILLLDVQIEQTQLLKKDIEAGLEKTNTAITNGAALKSSADVLKAELLKTDQKTTELKANRRAYADMLGLFINRSLPDETQLQTPPPPPTQTPPDITRPELQLFKMQQDALAIQNKLLTAKNLPRFSLFLQGGIGRPALNMLNNDFRGYYLGGLRLQWNLSGLYTYHTDRRLISLSQEAIAVQQNVFLFNTQIQLKQQNQELAKLRQLLTSDAEIINLRQNIANTTKNQLAYGTATPTDYLAHLNAQDQARLALSMHQLQLIMTYYSLQVTAGK